MSLHYVVAVSASVFLLTSGLLAHSSQVTDVPRASHLIPAETTTEVLPNGLTLITVPWNSPGTVAYYSLVQAGVRTELSNQQIGLSHLLEHLMFRGTKNLSQSEYTRVIQSLGADNNAYTEQDYTLYTLTGPSEALQELIRLESDRFQNIRYSEDEFKTEAQAVLGEYQKSIGTPLLPLWESLSDLAFEKHPYAHTVLGKKSHIETMQASYRTVLRYFNQLYTPDNTTLILVGDINHAQASTLVKKYYGAWKGKKRTSPPPVEPAQTEPRQITTTWPTPLPPILAVGYRIPGMDSSDPRNLEIQAALDILQLLLFHPSSDFYQEQVVTNHAILDLKYWEGKHHRDDHLLLAALTLRPGVNSDAMLESLQEAINHIARGSLDPTKLESVRNHLRYSLALQMETPAQVANTIAKWISLGGNARSLDEYLLAVERVPAEVIAQTAKAFLIPSRRNVVALQSNAGGKQ